MGWHSTSYKKVFEKFDVDPKKGLRDEQIGPLKEEYGSNNIITLKQKSLWILFLEQFNEPVIYILMVAAILNAILLEPQDSIVIGVVVIINTLIGFIQEQKSSNALKELSKMAAPNARVIRNGEQVSIPTTEVVAGDVIVLESGIRVPADARLVETQNLLVDESMLTGESFVVAKNHDAQVESLAPLGDRITMVFSGTIIQKGRALAVVTSVGNNTEFGKISINVAEADETLSPLQIKMAKFSKTLSYAILACVGAIFAIGFIRGEDYMVMLLTSVGLAVSAIPEGLPVAVTITLSIGVSQMAKRKAVVKRLAAVETLGSTNVICTDKTGTLTRNQMIVTKLFSGGEDFEISGSGYSIEGKATLKETGEQVLADYSQALKMSALIGAYCTETGIQKNSTDWKITGDPTEAALMIAASKLDYKCKTCTFTVDIPFESENQLMAVKSKIDGKDYTFVKGAPEKILNRCSKMVDKNGALVDLDDSVLQDKIEELSNKGLRVLALAYSDNDVPEQLTIFNLKNLYFAGFAGIEDSVRPEVITAVDECHSAGVDVVMITGDHHKTAKAVSKSVGIGNAKEEPLAIDGVEINTLSDDALMDKVRDVDVYARVAPEHKLRIVKGLQRNGNIVAMTGDGVNDAPALKQADIGVSMGSGTDVAKETSDMVLMDDNFATIVKAVRRGRIVLKNLKHIILYILATSFGGLLTIAVSVIAGLPLPILPAQLLWINLVTDGTSTFPLGFEKEHGDVMSFPPAHKDAPLVSRNMIKRIVFAGTIMMLGTLGAFYLYSDNIFAATGYELRHAQTIAFCMLAFFQIWNVQNSRSLRRSLFFSLPFTPRKGEAPIKKEKLDRVSPVKNPILLAVMLLAITLQVAAVELPFMNDLLHTVNLGFEDWGVILGVSFSIIIFVEILKIIHAFYLKFKK